MVLGICYICEYVNLFIVVLVVLIYLMYSGRFFFKKLYVNFIMIFIVSKKNNFYYVLNFDLDVNFLNFF